MSDEQERYCIEVDVDPAYVADQSDPAEDRYVFSYTITIKNLGAVTAQVVSRHWVITDGSGHEREVRGEGVVGEQPRIKPGEGFRYTSGAILETPVGSMHGSYHLVAEDGTVFNADIPAFTLAVPHTLH
ncbi:Co2+/Mg2+ efflux protein ApaG [Alkalilimnicola ehrlichii MLHE-1]|uniref:Protein ApaG n=1 Tax=Alkalilimnicola ehrlichii (strain ATCC BAA-1101 / DSM 17681 / MLHE-1) TaxID=187272 RepID=Q0AC60_ALKEH|nr:Co2+/Mg2+ efflux protein ApaG [Alkalilimnicola ehrlichii]ABI55577.1 ApaG domain protein [Alkalilimnicola ehrlichii MLHE-1]